MYSRTVPNYRRSGLLLEFRQLFEFQAAFFAVAPKQSTHRFRIMAKYASAFSTDTVESPNSLQYLLWVARCFVFFHRYSIGWLSGEYEGKEYSVIRVRRYGPGGTDHPLAASPETHLDGCSIGLDLTGDKQLNLERIYRNALLARVPRCRAANGWTHLRLICGLWSGRYPYRLGSFASYIAN